MDHTSVLINLYHPFPRTLSLSLPSTTLVSSLSQLLTSYCPIPQQLLQHSSGLTLHAHQSLKEATSKDGNVLFLRLSVKVLGGKGGFASQLRAQGGRMSSNKAQNTDSCRGLDGRRLSTIKEAQRLAKVLESAPDRQAAATKAAAAKLEQLQQEIKQLERAAGVESAGSTSTGGGPVASGSGIGSSTSSSTTTTAGGSSGGGGTKRRLEDSKYVEESREIVSSVKDAVRAAMLKKRKKANTPSTSTTATSATSSSTSTSTSITAEKENEAPPPVDATVVEEAVEGDKAGEEQQEEEEEEVVVAAKGKGKGKASSTTVKGKGKGKAKA